METVRSNEAVAVLNPVSAYVAFPSQIIWGQTL